MAGRILVLDDEENYAEMLKDLLRDNNYRVDMATRPERAIDQLEEIPYDLVISDYKMPVMDGADFLKKARELYPNLPFILVSGLMNTPELVKVANMSVTLVMEKPLDTAAFLKHVARFSEPMSEEEKASQENDPEGDGAAAGQVISYPEEPRFFSAVSPAAKRFMQQAWQIAATGHELYILDPGAGDAELAAKDISQWRGNGDLPVVVTELPATAAEAVAKVRSVLAEFDQSNTLVFRLDSAAQVRSAHSLVETALREVEGSDSMLLIFAHSGEIEPSAVHEEVAPLLLTLPPLAIRPSDVASYTRRFARIAAERVGKTGCATMSPEAVYELLAFDWPGGYKQIQTVVMHAVNASEEDAPVPLGPVLEALGVEDSQVSPDQRLLSLMKQAQRRYFEVELASRGCTAAELAQQLELDRSAQTREDLATLPLIKSELGQL